MIMNCWNLKHLLILGAVFIAPFSHGAIWLNDLNAAKAQAAREGKTVMINFTGSDWCPWCVKLKQEVFAQPDFDAYASRALVLVEIDFPKRKPLSAAMQKANSDLTREYRIDGFPALVFLNSKGKEVSRGGYEPGGTKPFLQKLVKVTGVSSDPATDAPSPARAAVPARSEPVRDVPLFGGAAVGPAPRYSGLTLKSISGPNGRRLVLINNQTFGLGESARVKLGDGEVKVRCEEIRSASAVVSVEGQPGVRELKLAGSQ